MNSHASGTVSTVSEFYNAKLSEDGAQALRRLRMRTVREVSETPDSKKALAKTLAAIDKQWGAGVLAPIKLMADRHDVKCISTGFPEMDDVISGKTVKIDGRRRWVKGSGRGLPRARIVEIFGPESSGKTTWTLQMVKAWQERGKVVAFIDAEHALDMDYADHIGCDTDAWLYSQGAESAEGTLSLVVQLVERGDIDLIVVDSVAALTPQAELDGEVGDYHVGVHARLMSQALRKLSAVLKRGHRCTVIFVNQTRSKIGVRYGDPETTTGGNALKFYASVRFRISSLGEIKKGGEMGIRSKVKVRKTKLGVPGGEVYLDITGGNGITACYSSDPREKKGAAADADDD